MKFVIENTAHGERLTRLMDDNFKPIYFCVDLEWFLPTLREMLEQEGYVLLRLSTSMYRHVLVPINTKYKLKVEDAPLYRQIGIHYELIEETCRIGNVLHCDEYDYDEAETIWNEVYKKYLETLISAC